MGELADRDTMHVYVAAPWDSVGELAVYDRGDNVRSQIVFVASIFQHRVDCSVVTLIFSICSVVTLIFVFDA